MNDMDRKIKPCVCALHLRSRVMRSGKKKSPFSLKHLRLQKSSQTGRRLPNHANKLYLYVLCGLVFITASMAH